MVSGCKENRLSNKSIHLARGAKETANVQSKWDERKSKNSRKKNNSKNRTLPNALLFFSIILIFRAERKKKTDLVVEKPVIVFCVYVCMQKKRV